MYWKNNGITLVALIITIIVLLILAGVSLSFVFNGGILDKSQQAVNEYQNAVDEESNLLDKIDQYLKDKLDNNEKDNEEFQVKKDGSFDGKQNSPKLASNMTAVYWNGNEEKKLLDSNTDDEWSNWYNYIAATDDPTIESDDLNESKWANAITEDGSYWVWIPRFAYKINSDTQTIDIKFINGIRKHSSGWNRM